MKKLRRERKRVNEEIEEEKKPLDDERKRSKREGDRL